MSVVVGYQSTTEGSTALSAAREAARAKGSRLVVVVSERADRVDETRARARDEDLARVTAELASEGVDHEVRVLEGAGDVADDLVRVAEETSASLVVIGLRRRSPTGKLVLGANAQRVLLDAPCPVLAVKPTPATA
ncbi:universal stress protein [Sanguibacter sp. HDW7]|uniref:universal stress protein n=1 Tax=Sanguibacter sp. HDW7 TaxID=2714931 RepID=UPI001409DE40|nr:universal stress protein [Sanguibacter sp. HDW7]QIK83692.1 universal stress protein [Sanguibacter sp. HDW7]